MIAIKLIKNYRYEILYFCLDYYSNLHHFLVKDKNR